MNEIERELIIRVYQIIKSYEDVDLGLEVFEVQYWNKCEGLTAIVDKLEADYDVVFDRTALAFDIMEVMFVANARASLGYSTGKRGIDKILPSDVKEV